MKNKILILFISLYVMLAEVVNFMSIKHSVAVGISILFLFLIGLVNRYLYILIAGFSLIINTIIIHILIHWGGGNGLFGRFQVAILSPQSEIKEYITNYITIMDVIEIIYFIVGLVLLKLFFSLNCKEKYKKYIYGLIIVISLVFAFLGIFKKIVPFSYIDYYKNANLWKTEMKEREVFIKKHYQNKNTNLIYDKIVVIMGESVNKHYLGVYGYKYNTTPFLKSLNPYVFDVIAPTNQTRYSIPIDFSQARVEDFGLYKKSISIVTLFKEYGYKTYWLSNQFKVGEFDSYITSMAKEADYSKIENLQFAINHSEVKPDEILLKELNKVYNPKIKQFFVFHLMGSHTSYNKRYDKNHILFKNPKNLVEEYDNSIFYTDYVLYKILDKFKNQKVLFIYLSDHSEVVNLKKHGHGFLPPFKDEYEVPLIIYSSIKNDNLMNLKKQNNKKINLENFYYIIQNLALNKDNNISYNKKVMAVTPSNIFDYFKLKFYK